MNLDVDKWSLLEKAQDYRFLLRLLSLALVADLLLALSTGTNLLAFHWGKISDQPGLLVVLILAYSMAMTVGAATVSWIVTELLIPLVSTIQSRLNLSSHRPKPDPLRYVSWSEAEEWLAQQTDAAHRAPVTCPH
ncbi:hypothetical protein [Xanthomonas translucens]|uniref:hypothetical protein n=1 Tax=Xanthomonas campestris pv. translucens TaxID=343 RepID=UPI0011118C79|nr:hypothetical protein [Xanthomonas translucens]QEO26394.1 hypothetical protein F0H32_09525 [Xanthomonas translucens pv. undulosa]